MAVAASSDWAGVEREFPSELLSLGCALNVNLCAILKMEEICLSLSFPWGGGVFRKPGFRFEPQRDGPGETASCCIPRSQVKVGFH